MRERVTWVTRSIRAVIIAGILAIPLSPAMGADPQPLPRPVHALGDHPDRPLAAPNDVRSVDAIVTAFAESISAPAGGAIDVKRLDSLFVPGGHIAIGVDPKAGRAADVVFVSPDEYADRFNQAMKKSSRGDGGFFDHVIANTVEKFGIMAHVYCAYASREHPDDPHPFRRGIKSFDLLQSGGRWYVVEVFYDFERPGTPIPAEYLNPTSR